MSNNESGEMGFNRSTERYRCRLIVVILPGGTPKYIKIRLPPTITLLNALPPTTYISENRIFDVQNTVELVH